MTNLVGLMILANLSRTYMRNETNTCKRKKKIPHTRLTHAPYIKRAKGKCPNWKRAVAKIKIEKALSTKKGRNKSLRLFHTPSPPFAKNTKRTQTVESGKKMAAFPRSQTTGYSDMRVSIRWDWAGYNPNLF